MRISTTLRREIRRAGREDGVSLYAIARDANLNYSTVHGFARGTKNLNMESIDAICSVLGGKLIFLNCRRPHDDEETNGTTARRTEEALTRSV